MDDQGLVKFGKIHSFELNTEERQIQRFGHSLHQEETILITSNHDDHNEQSSNQFVAASNFTSASDISVIGNDSNDCTIVQDGKHQQNKAPTIVTHENTHVDDERRENYANRQFHQYRRQDLQAQTTTGDSTCMLISEALAVTHQDDHHGHLSSPLHSCQTITANALAPNSRSPAATALYQLSHCQDYESQLNNIIHNVHVQPVQNHGQNHYQTFQQLHSHQSSCDGIIDRQVIAQLTPRQAADSDHQIQHQHQQHTLVQIESQQQQQQLNNNISNNNNNSINLLDTHTTLATTNDHGNTSYYTLLVDNDSFVSPQQGNLTGFATNLTSVAQHHNHSHQNQSSQHIHQHQQRQPQLQSHRKNTLHMSGPTPSTIIGTVTTATGETGLLRSFDDGQNHFIEIHHHQPTTTNNNHGQLSVQHHQHNTSENSAEHSQHQQQIQHNQMHHTRPNASVISSSSSSHNEHHHLAPTTLSWQNATTCNGHSNNNDPNRNGGATGNNEIQISHQIQPNLNGGTNSSNQNQAYEDINKDAQDDTEIEVEIAEDDIGTCESSQNKRKRLRRCSKRVAAATAAAEAVVTGSITQQNESDLHLHDSTMSMSSRPASPGSGSLWCGGGGNISADGSTNREMHNEIERRRRLRIKFCCDSLRTLIPNLNDKTDKATVLEHTVRYVRHLKDCPDSSCRCDLGA